MKIHIFGASGSGVTTLGNKLSEPLNFPYFDSDDYYWEASDPPFTIRRNPKLRNEQLTKALAQHNDWILGGSVINWGNYWLQAFDIAVFLWIPPDVRIGRLKQRELERYGETIFLNPQRNTRYNEFIAWASGYDDNTARGRTLAAHQTWMQQLTCPLIELRGDGSVMKRTKIILEKIKLFP